MLLGVAAGLVAALFLTATAEPSIERAIAIEHAAGHDGDDEVVARDVQKGIGLFAAYGLTGAGFALLFAAAFVLARRAQPDPFRRALLCGAGLAAALTLSPWLKYPPNPPAVGDPDTLARRQLLYLAVIVVTGAVVIGGAALARRLRAAGWDEPRRVAAVAAAVAVPLILVYGLLPPAPDAVNVPATLVWRFRVASLGGNLVLWAVLVLGFGVLTRPRERERAVVAT